MYLWSNFVFTPLCSDPIFTITNVTTTLHHLKPSAAGPDKLSSSLLKSSRLEIGPIITALFNLLIFTSFVPEQWKSANITPIPKVDHPQNPGDYRPIALTSHLCKVFERILAKFIISITKHIWQNDKQYGFLPGRSTMDAIIHVIDDWYYAKEENKAILPSSSIMLKRSIWSIT